VEFLPWLDVFTIIDRFIGKMFLSFFAAGLVVFSVIFLVADFTSTVARFGVGTGVLIRFYANYLPTVIYQMVPVGCLVATIFTVSTLNKSNELVALYSFGLSLARICMPILVFVGLISVLAFWVGDRVLPVTMRNRNYIYYVEMKKKPDLFSTVKQDRIWYRSNNVIFNIGVFRPEESIAQGLTMYYFDEAWKLVQLVRARDVAINRSSWTMRDGTVTLFTEDSSFPLTRQFKEKTVSMSEDLADITTSRPSSEAMTVKELKRYIDRNRAIGLDTRSFEVDYQGKFAFAFAGFVLAILGLPFSTRSQRAGGAMMNIAIVAGMALVYWILFSACLSLGKHGTLPPLVAAWGPNLAFFGAAAYLLKRQP
jgi:lipopolysaccharide export system permease protein